MVVNSQTTTPLWLSAVRMHTAHMHMHHTQVWRTFAFTSLRFAAMQTNVCARTPGTSHNSRRKSIRAHATTTNTATRQRLHALNVIGVVRPNVQHIIVPPPYTEYYMGLLSLTAGTSKVNALVCDGNGNTMCNVQSDAIHICCLCAHPHHVRMVLACFIRVRGLTISLPPRPTVPPSSHRYRRHQRAL